MPETPRFPQIREAVASFPDRAHFRSAVSALLAAGFEPTDLSVLATHQPLGAADRSPGDLLAGITAEARYIGPLTVAGFSLVSGGPIGAALAGVVAAGISGTAVFEFLEDYAAAPHRAEFAAALKAGAVLLWVRCADPELELRATRILEESGGRNVHVNARIVKEPGG